MSRGQGRNGSDGDRFDAEGLEQVAAEGGERRVGAVARVVEFDAAIAAEATTVEDQHAVGEHDRLVDVVGHEQHGGLVAGAELAAAGRASSIRVSASSAPNGSSSRRSSGSRTRARARATRCASPPDSVTGQASGMAGQADLGERLVGQLLGAGVAGESELDVGPDPSPGQQPRLLEHDGAGVRDEDRPVVVGIEPTERSQQRALAGSAPAQQGDELVAFDVEIDVGVDLPAVERPADTPCDDRAHVPSNPRRQPRRRRSSRRTNESVANPRIP